MTNNDYPTHAELQKRYRGIDITKRPPITEDDVFREICRRTVFTMYDRNFASVPELVYALKTTTHYARKHVKTLLEKGLIRLVYEGGIDDEGCVHCCRGYQATVKGKETEIYKEEYQREIDDVNRIFFGKED